MRKRWLAALAGGAPKTVAMYAVYAANGGLNLSSFRVTLATIQAAHGLAGTTTLNLRHPRLVMLLEGIDDTKSSHPAKQATAAGSETMRY